MDHPPFPSSSSAKKLLSGLASAAATAVLIQSMAGRLLPRPLQHFLWGKLLSLFSSFSISSRVTLTIDEFQGIQPNQLFQAAHHYLSSKISPDTTRFRAVIPAKDTRIVLSMDNNQQVSDLFNGAPFTWRKLTKQTQTSSRPYNDGLSRQDMYSVATVAERSFLELSFHKKHHQTAINDYLPHIVSKFLETKAEKTSINIHMMRGGMDSGISGHRWVPVKLDHPATFETLAMDPNTKKMIQDDLDLFVSRKEFYRKVGKAWKRGYLLFGPPGTGKSSLIAAIANYLKFDVYDLQLSNLGPYSDPRSLVFGTANRSILVVEDIDCSIQLDNREVQTVQLQLQSRANTQPNKKVSQITLSSLLNFIDGLWSTCGDERIIIFTTNHKERLDPALLRPGRMDVHIHMSYCTPCGFRMLALNYLGMTHHSLFGQVEELIGTTKVTPAEVGEQLMKTPDPEAAMRGLMEFLILKNEKVDEAESPEIEDAEETGAVGTSYSNAMVFPGLVNYG